MSGVQYVHTRTYMYNPARMKEKSIFDWNVKTVSETNAAPVIAAACVVADGAPYALSIPTVSTHEQDRLIQQSSLLPS